MNTMPPTTTMDKGRCVCAPISVEMAAGSNPRIAEPMKLEAQAGALEAELDDVETKRQAEQWHQAAGEFLDEVDESDGGGGDEDLKEQMKQFGWDRTTRTLKGFGGGGYQLQVYKKSLRSIADELRDRVQQLLLSELTSTGDETPPVQYEGMVTRYQKALTMGTRGNETKTQRAKDRRTK